MHGAQAAAECGALSRALHGPGSAKAGALWRMWRRGKDAAQVTEPCGSCGPPAATGWLVCQQEKLHSVTAEPGQNSTKLLTSTVWNRNSKVLIISIFC